MCTLVTIYNNKYMSILKQWCIRIDVGRFIMYFNVSVRFWVLLYILSLLLCKPFL